MFQWVPEAAHLHPWSGSCTDTSGLGTSCWHTLEYCCSPQGRWHAHHGSQVGRWWSIRKDPQPETEGLKALQAQFTVVAFRTTVGLQRVKAPRSVCYAADKTDLASWGLDSFWAWHGSAGAVASRNREGRLNPITMLLCLSSLQSLVSLTSPRLYTVRPPSPMGNTGRPEGSRAMGWTSLRAPPSSFFFLDVFFRTETQIWGHPL